MAYKFQLGAAVLSGSLTQEGQVLAKDSALSGSSLSLAGTAVSSTAAELNLVDGSSAGTIVNSKAVVYGSSGEVNATTLQIGGSSITATADEINLLDGITRGSILVGGSGGSAELDAKTSGRILVGDGTDIASVAVSGDATLAANGALTIAAGAIEHGMLAEDIISGQANLGGTGVDDADEFMLSDAGTIKAITGANLYGWVFSKVSGDATVASGGALTIANDAVEQAMIADDAVGADQLAANAVVDASVASNAAILASKIQFNTGS